jgi:hypothetical protein
VTKKRSAKASVQRDDRAFAEFEALTRNLVKQPMREIGVRPVNASRKKPSR